MRTIKTANPKVITNEQIDVITELIETSLFQGPDYDHDKSLFEFGFVYDSNTGIAIVTKKMFMWENMKEPLTFKIGEVNMDDIHAIFKANKEAILKISGLDESDWMAMCDSYKIMEIEQFNLGLTHKMPVKHYSIDALTKYLKDYVKKHYAEILD
mgnify:CR=1 FL=1